MISRNIFPMLPVILVIVLVLGCGKSISDEEIKAQVTDWVLNYTNGRLSDLFAPSRFGDYFDIKDVTIKDKFVTKTECIALCAVTYQAKHSWVAHSGLTISLGFIIGDGPGRAGEVRTWEMKFLFRKYEKGWRLEGPESPKYRR